MARGRLALNKDRNKVERKEKAKTVKRRDTKGRKEGIRETRMKEGSWHLSMRVNESEGAALAAQVNKRRSCLEVLCQTQGSGAGGKQGDREEVHLCNCADRPLWLWSGLSELKFPLTSALYL